MKNFLNQAPNRLQTRWPLSFGSRTKIQLFEKLRQILFYSVNVLFSSCSSTLIENSWSLVFINLRMFGCPAHRRTLFQQPTLQPSLVARGDRWLLTDVQSFLFDEAWLSFDLLLRCHWKEKNVQSKDSGLLGFLKLLPFFYFHYYFFSIFILIFIYLYSILFLIIFLFFLFNTTLDIKQFL